MVRSLVIETIVEPAGVLQPNMRNIALLHLCHNAFRLLECRKRLKSLIRNSCEKLLLGYAAY
ncbi:hypothetical protein D3C78_1087940 [compost metagenome]